MKKQKGQSLVEFALVIPFFLLLIFGLIYSGMLFHDYTSLSNTPRSAAREAAIMEGTDYTSVKNYYNDLSLSTITSMYKKDPDPNKGFIVSKGSNDNEVYVRIRMVRTVTSPLLEIVLPPSFDIVYFMKKDTPNTNTNNPSPSGG